MVQFNSLHYQKRKHYRNNNDERLYVQVIPGKPFQHQTANDRTGNKHNPNQRRRNRAVKNAYCQNPKCTNHRCTQKGSPYCNNRQQNHRRNNRNEQWQIIIDVENIINYIIFSAIFTSPPPFPKISKIFVDISPFCLLHSFK